MNSLKKKNKTELVNQDLLSPEKLHRAPLWGETNIIIQCWLFCLYLNKVEGLCFKCFFLILKQEKKLIVSVQAKQICWGQWGKK